MIILNKKTLIDDSKKQMDGTDIPPGIISQRHIGNNMYILKQGLSTDRPSNPPIERFYFATDTNVLSVYNKVSKTWVSTTLS